jgi:putative endonuclease
MGYYVYLLRCRSGALYTGITTDLTRRFAEHAGKGGRGAKYTAADPPERFEYAFSAPDRSAASRLEYRLKSLTRAEKEGLLRGNVPVRLELGDCRPVQITGSGGRGCDEA